MEPSRRDLSRWRRVWACRPGPDGVLSVGAGLGVACGAAVLFQRRYFGEGPGYVLTLAGGGGRFDVYPLYMPAAEGLWWLAGVFGLALDAEGALRWVTLLGAFLFGMGVYLACRGEAEPRALAVGMVLLAAFTPNVLFYLTTIETAALHAGAAAIAYAGAASMRPERAGLRALVLSIALVAVVGTHVTGCLLVPGLVAWTIVRGRERGLRFKAVHVGLFFLPWLAAFVVVIGKATSWFSRPLIFDWFVGWHRDALVARLRDLPSLGGALRHLGEAMGLPTAIAFAGGAGGLLRLLPTTPSRFLVGALCLLPYAAGLAVWRYEDHGVYFVALVPLLSILTGGFLQSGLRSLPGPILLRAGILVACFLPIAAWRIGAWRHAGPPAVLAPALVGWWVGLRERRAGRGEAIAPPLAAATLGLLVLGQAALSISTLAERNRTDPEAQWVADASRALPPGSFVLTAGNPESSLLRLRTAIHSEDAMNVLRFVSLEAAAGAVGAIVRGGHVVVLDDRTAEIYRDEPLVLAFVEELRRRFELVPVFQGSFHAHRLLPREGGGERPK